MYTDKNYKTKKALKEDVAAGKEVTFYQPGPFIRGYRLSGNEPTDGTITLEGPWFPEPHRWYARATVKNGVIVKVD